MFNYWISFLFLFLSWISALFMGSFSVNTIIWSGLFFSLYFITPILKRSLTLLIYFILPIIIAVMFYGIGFNGSIWLIYLVLAVQAAPIFESVMLFTYAIFLYLLAAIPHVIFEEWHFLVYLTLLASVTGALYFYLRRETMNVQELQIENSLLKDEFHSIKRQLIYNEESVRQEERNQIAREIHDAVGHRLTALLMQLEVERIKAPNPEVESKFAELKQLAQASLYDTREAVRALQSEETSGIQAIIQLIRKLEAESQLRLTITMQAGVLGVYLSNQQSVVIYRTIQEALTNMMRHSSSRQASIEFQIIANTQLRFTVSHPIKEKIQIKEGFGLKNIRARLIEIDGRLTLDQLNQSFNLSGQFPIRGEEDD